MLNKKKPQTSHHHHLSGHQDWRKKRKSRGPKLGVKEGTLGMITQRTLDREFNLAPDPVELLGGPCEQAGQKN